MRNSQKPPTTELIAALSNANGSLRHGIFAACTRRRQRRTSSQGHDLPARVFISDAMERVEHEAKRAIAAVNEGTCSPRKWYLNVLKRPQWTHHLRRGTPPPSIPRTATRSKAADRFIYYRV
jgi:hypothetical protein